MPRYRKKSVTVEAHQVTTRNGVEIAQWCNGEAFDVAMAPGHTHHVNVVTSDGVRANVGDYVIRRINGEYSVCDPDVFAETYEAEDEIVGVRNRFGLNYCSGCMDTLDASSSKPEPLTRAEVRERACMSCTRCGEAL